MWNGMILLTKTSMPCSKARRIISLSKETIIMEDCC